jgi:hypothetical protein
MSEDRDLPPADGIERHYDLLSLSAQMKISSSAELLPNRS